jgi:MFS family permease
MGDLWGNVRSLIVRCLLFVAAFLPLLFLHNLWLFLFARFVHAKLSFLCATPLLVALLGI